MGVYPKETTECTQIRIYKGMCCSIRYNIENFKVICIFIYIRMILEIHIIRMYIYDMCVKKYVIEQYIVIHIS